MSGITRRTFLLAVAGGGMAVAASAAAWSWFRGEPEWVVLAILRRRVGYLGVDDAVYRRFAGEYLDSRARYRQTLARLSLLAWPLRIASPYEWLAPGNSLRRLEDNVVSKFLLSTDFFHNGADETRVPEYVAFFDPSLQPCRNPFAVRPDPS